MTDTATTAEPSPAKLFVQALQNLSDSDVRALRSAIGQPRGSDVRVYDVFNAVFRPLRRKRFVKRWACYLVATLYPWHPAHGPPADESFGATMRRLRPPSRDREARARADRRFTRLLDANGRDLTFQLTACVRLLARRDPPVRIDWTRLLDDLSDWHDPGQPTQRAWAADYFKP